MVGHHSSRYERFGWAAARLDDLANLAPARITAVLAAALAPAVGGSGRTALRTVLRDGGAHPSPNAGRCEAAFAGALGVSLGGTNVYQGRAERRGTLGDGPPPGPADLDRAIRLSRLITAVATVLAAATAYLLGARRRPARPGMSAPIIETSAPIISARVRALSPASVLLWAVTPMTTFFCGRWRGRPQKSREDGPGARGILVPGTAGTP
jgi:hypothetical protein